MQNYIYQQFKNTIGLKVENKGDPDFCAEHFDFVLENVNEKLKQNLTWAPTDSEWLVSYRTLDLVQKLTKKLTTSSFPANNNLLEI